MNLRTRIKQAAGSRDSAIAVKRQSKSENLRQFREWAMQILAEVGQQRFKIDGCQYTTEVVDWRSEIKVVVMRGKTRWKDIENKHRLNKPWFITLAKINDRGNGYWSVWIRGEGDFRHYSDLPEGKTDCYCTPENRERRISEIKQAVEDALIEFINP